MKIGRSKGIRGAAMWRFLLFGLLLGLGFAAAGTACAGMPAVLPSSWTVDQRPPPSVGSGGSQAAPFLQAISFFIVVLLVCGWAVKGLWNVLRKDFAWLPALSYGRSLSLVVLWGLLFVVVLTMISGARELMTPGAWRKQGWTYKLADTTSPAISAREERRRALEQLRQALWQYAATHKGYFPPADDPAIDKTLWNIPGWPGLRFLYVPGRTAEDIGRLLVHEPELDGDERQVLLTHGLIGTMRTAEIRKALESARSP